MDHYEAKNTRLLVDVNTAEDDIVQGTSDYTLSRKKQLTQKIKHVKETIEIMKERIKEARRKNDFFSAPKKVAAMKKKQEKEKGKKKKEKVVGMELTFPTDHPDVPKMLQTIHHLHAILFDNDGKSKKGSVTGRS